MRITWFLGLSFLCIIAAKSVYSQQKGTTQSILGKVIDATTQEPLIGANVIVLGTSFGSATNLDGEFSIASIAPGTYRVQASMIGYKPQIKTDVVVAAGRQNQLLFALQTTVIDFEAVVVEADYFRKDPDTPISAQTLSYEEIRRAPGGQEDVVRSIAVLPGVVQVSAGRNDLIVRGGAPSENLYVIDNLQIPNINHFGVQGATGGPLSFVNLDFVRDVTFSTGGFNVRYGDKLSSVLNIQLKEGRNDRLGGKVTIAATQFGINAEGPAGEAGSFLISARRSYLDFLFKAAGFGFVPEYWDFLGKAVYQTDKSNEFGFLVISALDNVRFFNDSEDKRYDNSRILGNSQDQYVSSLSWKHLTKDGFITTSIGRTYTNYDFLQSDSLLMPIFSSSSKEGETNIQSDAIFLLDRNTELSFGAKSSLSRVNGKLVLAQNPYFPGREYTNQWDTTSVKASAYTQISRRLFDLVRLTIGGRVDYFNLIENKLAFSPRGSLAISLMPQTTINISGGMYVQSPSYIWLVSNSLNTKLEFIKGAQVVAGIEHLFRTDTKVRLEGYLKRYRDYPTDKERPYLIMANTGAGFGGADEGFASFGFNPLLSEGTGLALGIEFLIQKRLSDIPCYGIFSLSYNRSDFTALDGVRRPSLFDQRVIFNLSGGYQLSEEWEFSLKFRFGTGTPYTPFLADGTPDFTAYNGERLPPFHSLDIRVDKRWDLSTWNLITYIDIQNIYNRRNIQGYRWDYRSASSVATGSTIGILPSIGISAEF